MIGDQLCMHAERGGCGKAVQPPGVDIRVHTTALPTACETGMLTWMATSHACSADPFALAPGPGAARLMRARRTGGACVFGECSGAAAMRPHQRWSAQHGCTRSVYRMRIVLCNIYLKGALRVSGMREEVARKPAPDPDTRCVPLMFLYAMVHDIRVLKKWFRDGSERCRSWGEGGLFAAAWIECPAVFMCVNDDVGCVGRTLNGLEAFKLCFG